MTPAPGKSDCTSSFAVSGFMAMRKSISFLRATQPCFEARMVYQVGSPAMLEGKRFLPETGTPMRKIERSNTLFADCEPEPFKVATCIEKSLTIRLVSAVSERDLPCTTRLVVGIKEGPSSAFSPSG